MKREYEICSAETAYFIQTADRLIPSIFRIELLAWLRENKEISRDDLFYAFIPRKPHIRVKLLGKCCDPEAFVTCPRFKRFIDTTILSPAMLIKKEMDSLKLCVSEAVSKVYGDSYRRVDDRS